MALLKTRLSVMMFLEFFIWGAWLPLIFGYLPSLGFTPGQQSWILNAFPIASIVGMFFSNQFADRNFAAEKFLAFSHLIGGLAMLGLGFTKEFWPFFGLMFIHCLLYVPTISITNSIAFANMKELRCDAARVHLRVLFCFDPRRTAILLLGGDKTGAWNAWYAWAISVSTSRSDERNVRATSGLMRKVTCLKSPSMLCDSRRASSRIS